MPSKLIIVSKAGVVSKSLKLDTDATLDAIRTILEQQGIMQPTDLFLNSGSEIDQSQEPTITLGDLLGDSGTTLTIGAGTTVDPIATGDGVQHYNEMSTVEKMALFKNINLFNGIVLNATSGFGKSFKTAYSWKSSALPDALQPTIATEIDYSYSFSKLTQSLLVNSVDKGSVNASCPYGDASAEFSYEQSKKTSSEQSTEYIVGKFLVRKVSLSVDATTLVPNPAFGKDMADALAATKDEFQQYLKVLTVLNDWGYYVPLQFTLGGALYSTDSATISEFSQAETEKKEFGGSFKASFEGIGGGGSYSHASGSEQTTTSSSKYQITSFNQIGGSAGSAGTGDKSFYSDWAKSLDKAIYWDVIAYDKLYPTLGLITDVPTMNACLALMDKYADYPNAVTMQPCLNMQNYATAVQNLFANPWGN